MPYQIADNYNNAAGLVDISPQPASPGILYPREVVAVSGVVYDDGAPYTMFVYKGVMSNTQYNSLLTQFGLTSARTNEVTVRLLLDDRITYANYNAIVVKPRNGVDAKYRNGFWHDVTFRVKQLEAV